MGKVKLLAGLKSRASALWNRFLKKSPLFIALTGLTVVSVFGLGVGGTLAATGVLPNGFPWAPATEPADYESSRTSSAPPADGILPSDVEEPLGSCPLGDSQASCVSKLGTSGEKNKRLQDSGWTGVTHSFAEQSVYLVWAANITSDGVGVNARIDINGMNQYSRWDPCDWKGAKTCGEVFQVFITGQPMLCQPGGDTYLIEVVGAGLNFRETGVIPAGVIDCPTPVSSLSPSPESVVVKPSPESSPTPGSSSEPVSSPTPTP
jgi:hypothetical protein